MCRGASSGRDIRTLPASPTQGSGEGLVGSEGHGQKGKIHGQEAGGLQLLIPGFLPSQQHRLLLPVKSERGCLTFPGLQCSLLLIVQGDGLSVSRQCLGKLLIYVIYLTTGHFLGFS